MKIGGIMDYKIGIAIVKQDSADNRLGFGHKKSAVDYTALFPHCVGLS
jgi:hypothetical protein